MGDLKRKVKPQRAFLSKMIWQSDTLIIDGVTTTLELRSSSDPMTLTFDLWFWNFESPYLFNMNMEGIILKHTVMSPKSSSW